MNCSWITCTEFNDFRAIGEWLFKSSTQAKWSVQRQSVWFQYLVQDIGALLWPFGLEAMLLFGEKGFITCYLNLLLHVGKTLWVLLAFKGFFEVLLIFVPYAKLCRGICQKHVCKGPWVTEHDCRWGNKTYIQWVRVRYWPVDGGIRLRS